MQCMRPHQEGRARPSLFFVSDSIGLFNGLGWRRTVHSLARFGCRAAAGRAGHLQRARERVALHRMGFGRLGIGHCRTHPSDWLAHMCRTMYCVYCCVPTHMTHEIQLSRNCPPHTFAEHKHIQTRGRSHLRSEQAPQFRAACR